MTNTNENNSAINTNEGNAMTNDVNETIETETATAQAEAEAAQALLLTEAVEGYQDGTKTMKQAHTHAGIGQNAFRMELARRKVTVTRGRNRDWDVKDAFAACQDSTDDEGVVTAGETPADVAKRLGVAVGTLYSSFHKAGLSLSGDKNTYTDEHGVRARAIYETGISMADTATALVAEFEGLTGEPASPTLRAMIVKAGGTIRKRGEGAKGGGRKAQTVPAETVAKVKAMREAGDSSFDIAVACDLTLGVLNRVLKDAGLVKSRGASDEATDATDEVAPEPIVVAPEPAPVALFDYDQADLERQTVKSLLSILKDAGVELGKDRTKANLVALCNENKLTA
jgi:hypothetical protein